MVDDIILGKLISFQHALIGELCDHQSFQIVLEIFEKNLIVVGREQTENALPPKLFFIADLLKSLFSIIAEASKKSFKNIEFFLISRKDQSVWSMDENVSSFFLYATVLLLNFKMIHDKIYKEFGF